MDEFWIEKKVELPEDLLNVGPVPISVNENKLGERDRVYHERFSTNVNGIIDSWKNSQ
ncbi:10012_t:CDS:2 [Diversispora eburnea]|uniref:10012_t:CDS:1 n=1 Tax=Diversispora eburnea TaxID=1213867 RepID=A0A9N8ZM40_9GLOM|nr:10012_t:CDS:2 [Diversispora eburnea]